MQISSALAVCKQLKNRVAHKFMISKRGAHSKSVYRYISFQAEAKHWPFLGREFISTPRSEETSFAPQNSSGEVSVAMIYDQTNSTRVELHTFLGAI